MQLGWSDEGEVRPPSPSQAPSLRLQAVHGTPPSARICGQTRLWSVFIVSTCSDVIILFPAMISGIFERTMKRRGVRESDPFDWEKVSFLQQRHDNYHRDNNRQDNHYDHHHNHYVEPRLGATAQRAKGSVQETLRSKLLLNPIK